jgi:hypothetical protein
MGLVGEAGGHCHLSQRYASPGKVQRPPQAEDAGQVLGPLAE